MKKIISIIFVFFCSLSINAQWNGSFATNEYTNEKIPQVVYEFKYPTDGFIKYVNNQLQVYLFYNIYENVDLLTRMRVENNGWIKYDSEASLNFIGKKSTELLSVGAYVENLEKDEFAFVFAINDQNNEILNLLKLNTKLNIRYYDIVKESYKVISVSLIGFSKQYKRIHKF